MNRFKILDKHGKIDFGYLLFYYFLAIGVASFHLLLLFVTTSVAALIVYLSLIYRDEILRTNDDKLEELKSKLIEIESELTALRLSQGITRK